MGRAYEDCTADLQVDMITGALIEGVATSLCRLISRALGETNAKFGHILDAFFGTMMVVAGKLTIIYCKIITFLNKTFNTKNTTYLITEWKYRSKHVC